MNYQKLRPVGPVKRRRGLPPIMRAGIAVILITILAAAACVIAQGGVRL